MTALPVGRWRPLFAGRDRRRAEAILGAILRRVRRDALVHAHGLMAGHAGIVLLGAYVGRVYGDARAVGFARRTLEQALRPGAEAAAQPRLSFGYVGTAWLVQHVAGELVDPIDAETICATVDHALAERLAARAEEPHDLLLGLAGWGVYVLERPPSRSRDALAAGLVDALSRSAERVRRGARWKTPPSPHLAHPWFIEHFPAGYHDVGVAHGTPGVAAVLGGLAGAFHGATSRRAVALMDAALAWLWAERRARRWRTFPKAVGDVALRNQWCYGDVGVAAATVAAARAAGLVRWETRGVALGRHAALLARDAVYPEIHLCHGAAGVAHALHRLFVATGDDLFAEVATQWFRETLDWLEHPRILDHEIGGLLEGLAGVALALLAAAAPDEPRWDRLLALSFAPAREHA